MPQPLSSVPKITSWSYGAELFARHPELMKCIGEIVATSALIEYTWGMILGVIAKADPKAAIVMHQSLTSTSSQRAAFAALAKARLNDEEHNLFLAVQKALKGSSKIRNEFCHHIWADTRDDDDAYILVDPADVIHFSTPEPKTIPRDQRTYLNLDRSKLFVYRRKDIEEAKAKVNLALGIVSQYHIFLKLDAELKSAHSDFAGAVDWRDRAYAWLMAEPSVSRALQPRSPEPQK